LGAFYKAENEGILVVEVNPYAVTRIRDYPKVCVNLQTDVRYNYTAWRYYVKIKSPNMKCAFA
jgi:hypothetical protein